MRHNPRISAILFLFLTTVFVACSSPSQPEKNPAPASRSAFFADLERDLADIAGDCKDNLNCYWEKGHDHIEFNACRGRVLALFGSLAKCHEDSIAVLEDLIVELDLTSKKTRRRRRRRRSRSGGNNGSPPTASVTLNRELYDRVCSQDGVQCPSYDDLAGLSGSDICRQPAPVRALFSDLSCDGDGNNGDSGNGNGDGGNGGGSVQPPPTSTPCPTENPQASDKLADISFVRAGGALQTGRYLHSSLVPLISLFTAGSSSPSQNKLLRLEFRVPDNTKEVWLNKDNVSGLDNSANTWYVYISGNRYGLSSGSDSSRGGINLYEFSGNDVTGTDFDIGIGAKAVHLAYQDSSNNCHYISP